MLLMKNLQFLTNQAETLAILPIHEIVIFTKFQINWTKIVDFSLIAYFGASVIFYDSVSTYICTSFEKDIFFVLRYRSYVQYVPPIISTT